MPVRRRSIARLAALLLLASSASFVPAGAEPGRPLVAPGEVPMTPAVATALASLPSAAPYALFVHFEDGSFDANRSLVEGHGLVVTSAFPSVNAVYAVGTIGEIRGLTREPVVSYLEDNRKITFFQESTVWATRARVAQEAVAGGPYFDPAGNILDGQGTGIAIIDTGFDGSHPDLADHVARNFKVVCTTPLLINTTTEQCFGPVAFVDLAATGSTDDSGHGTHVAGIALGDGTASTGDYGTGVTPAVSGTFSGVAPAASLYGFGVVFGGTFLTVAESFQWIIDNNPTLEVPIKVVNNSWGSTPVNDTGQELAHDPNTIESKLINRLVADGVTIVFAAGNRSGTGTAAVTSPECTNPVPGVICVANYNDAGTGARNNVLSASSSRGHNDASRTHTYPDLSAPGTSAQPLTPALVANAVVSSCRPGLLTDCAAASGLWPGFYSTLAGTSMASPHVAGAVALLAQAVPGITPAQIEDVMQDTAHRFTAGAAYVADQQNSGGLTSFDKGAGLLDVKAALDQLGVPHAGAAVAPTPVAAIAAPLEGAVFDGSTPIAVEGTANDGTSTVPPSTQVLVTADGADFDGPGAADIDALRVTETAAGTSPGGFRYEVDLRNALDFGAAGTGVTLQISQSVDGRGAFTRVNMSTTGVSAVAGSTLVTSPATTVSRTGNTVSFFVPYANLGNPTASSAVSNVQVSTLIGTVVDVAPGASKTALADFNARPQYGLPYTVLRPDLSVPPVATATLSVDGGTAEPLPLTGTSPAYSFTDALDPAPLADGSHTLTVSLFLDGVHAASDSVTIEVDRPDPLVYEVAITQPLAGTTVTRTSTEVTGTSFTNDPSTDAIVTVELLGPEPLSATPAAGASAWTTTIDFARQAGDYTLVARLVVDGVAQATHQVPIVVPPDVSIGQVSCAPETVRFWQREYGSGNGPRAFSVAERGLLLDRAVVLSSGAFGTTEELRSALTYAGKPMADKVAARQFAALLLNLAAGDLSAAMSYQAGLSGAEGLDAGLYATGVIGSTVDAATAWIRAQFPGGDLGGAAEVADAINNGHGLICP